MNYVFVNYHYVKGFGTPQAWVKRVEIYGGILESLSKNNTVHFVNQIDYEGVYVYKNVQYHFVNFNKGENYFPWKMNRFVKRLRPHVVVVGGLHLPLQIIQLKAILNKSVKIIAHNHAEKPFTGIKKYLQRAADKYIDGYLFASRDMGLEWIAKGNLASPDKIHEVMEVSSTFNVIDKSVAKQKTGVANNAVFLWVGRLNDNKDPINTVKAFLKFAENNPDTWLYMIYHTDELLGAIKKLLNDNSDKNSIVLIGEVKHDDLLYWYNSADFILSGSHYEGSGTAICEAMSCGCVPVVTDILSFRMITDRGECGILYEAGNETALLSALNKSQQLNLPEMREKCLDYFDRNLSFEAIAAKIQEVIATL